MSETKKVVKKEVVKTAEVKPEVKAVEVKAEVKPVVKAAEVKPAVKAEAKPAKEVKETAKKAPATKKAPAAKKTASKTAEVFIQYAAKEVTMDEIEAKVKAAWANETGKKESSIKTVKIYVKPEENAAYYVINENNLGRVEL